MALYVSLGTQNLAVAGTAVGLTLPTGKVFYALITVETAVIRYSCSGTDPVASTTGTPRQVGEVFKVKGTPDLNAFRAIRDSGTSGALAIEYFGQTA